MVVLGVGTGRGGIRAVQVFDFTGTGFEIRMLEQHVIGNRRSLLRRLRVNIHIVAGIADSIRHPEIRAIEPPAAIRAAAAQPGHPHAAF